MKQESNSAEEHDWASKDEPQEIEQAVAFALTGAPINTSNGLEHRVQSLPLHPRAERGSGRRFASLTACASRLVKKWKKRKFVHSRLGRRVKGRERMWEGRVWVHVCVRVCVQSISAAKRADVRRQEASLVTMVEPWRLEPRNILQFIRNREPLQRLWRRCLASSRSSRH